MAATLDHDVAHLKRQLDEALAERDAAEARQAAMAEILEIINSSPGDLAPVFDATISGRTQWTRLSTSGDPNRLTAVWKMTRVPRGGGTDNGILSMATALRRCQRRSNSAT